LRIGRRQHPKPAQHQRHTKHQDQGRENPPDPPGVESKQTKMLLIQLAHDDADDQEAGDHEKNIDPIMPPGIASGKA
jgi:hypothetical protein